MQEVDGRILCEYCFAQIQDTDNVCPFCGFDPAKYTPEPGSIQVGEILAGRYLIGRMLGRGGFGITYLAYDVPQKRKVAIKEYLPEGLAVRNPGQNTLTIYTGEKEELFRKGSDKFFEEAKMVSRFNGNPNIVSVYEFFHDHNTAYFSMEYLDGMDLKKYVSVHGGRLSQEETIEILLPVINALTVVHSTGVLHRDISPDNIFITNSKESKLLDFGAAKQVIGESGKSVSVVVKQGFAPMEQYQTRGKFGPWSDIYALCATMYYAMTGKVPIPAMDRIEVDRLMPPSAMGIPIDPALERVLMRGLSYQPANRQQSMLEFKQEFTNALPRKEEPSIEDEYVNPYSEQQEKQANFGSANTYHQSGGFVPESGFTSHEPGHHTAYENAALQGVEEFAGKNAAYYRKQFEKSQAGRQPGFHAPAFLIPVYWFLYRKMYIAGAAIYAFQMFSSLIAAALISYLANPTGVYTSFSIVSMICTLAVAILSGIFANRLYYAQYKKYMQETAAPGADKDRLYRKKAGVTETKWMILLIVGMMVFSSVFSFVSYKLMSSAYNNYVGGRTSGSSGGGTTSFPSGSQEGVPASDVPKEEPGDPEEEAMDLVLASYYELEDKDTEVFEDLFEKVFRFGIWDTDVDDEYVYVTFTGDGFYQNQDVEFEYVFAVAGEEVSITGIWIDQEEVKEEYWDAVFQLADLYYQAMENGKEGAMGMMFVNGEYITTLSEAEYLLDGAEVKYTKVQNDNSGGERADLILSDNTKLSFFRPRAEGADVPDDHVLIMKGEEVDTAAFEKYFYGVEPNPAYSFFDMTSNEYLTPDQLQNLTQTDLYIMRNEIFAKHGRKFVDPFLRGLFSYTSWYNPQYEPSEFSSNSLNAIEKANVSTISEVEKQRGFNW